MTNPTLPPIAGHEAEILAVVQQPGPVFLPRSNLSLERIGSGFACTLHQPPRHQEALLHLLLLETSCFRYWGQGVWTD